MLSVVCVLIWKSRVMLLLYLQEVAKTGKGQSDTRMQPTWASFDCDISDADAPCSVQVLDVKERSRSDQVYCDRSVSCSFDHSAEGQIPGLRGKHGCYRQGGADVSSGGQVWKSEWYEMIIEIIHTESVITRICQRSVSWTNGLTYWVSWSNIQYIKESDNMSKLHFFSVTPGQKSL